jgi:dTDP-glucose 4,6-dehydratase
MRLIITGVCGFIGSAFARYVAQQDPDCEIVGIDALTYAGNLSNISELACQRDRQKFRFVHGRIGDKALLRDVLRSGDVVVNFAAETHVDRAIFDPEPFMESNFNEVLRLLEVSVERGIGRFIQISTDEVVGEYPEGFADEQATFNVGNTYAATKLGAEGLVTAFGKTHGLPWNITRCGNNYGPYQYPEKAIPLWINAALQDKPIPLYGNGDNQRCWVYVDDHAAAIWHVIKRGRLLERYNVASGPPVCNREIVRQILRICGKPASLIQFVRNRPGHDLRYAISAEKLYGTGFRPTTMFETGLQMTVDWYHEHPEWVLKIMQDPRYLAYMAEVQAFREGKR